MKVRLTIDDAPVGVIEALLKAQREAEAGVLGEPGPETVSGTAPEAAGEAAVPKGPDVKGLGFEEVETAPDGTDYPTVQEVMEAVRLLDLSRHREGLRRLVEQSGAKTAVEVPPEARRGFIEAVRELSRG